MSYVVKRAHLEYTVEEFASRNSNYAVIIPVLNEGDRISSLSKKMLHIGIQNQFDLIIVDGGSTDGSISAENLASWKINTLLVKLSKGSLGSQLQIAYDYSLNRGYDGVITIDGNDKDNPQAIFAFRDSLMSGVDFAQGSRFIKGGSHANTPLSRILAIRLIHAPLLSLTSGFPWTDTTQGFRGYSKKLLKSPTLNIFRQNLHDYRFLFYISHMSPRLNFRCVELPTERIYPNIGPTPTKIKGLNATIRLISALFFVCIGRYNPPRVTGKKSIV